MIKVLLGPNGAGKSTYLRRRMGIESGKVDRASAMVFQEPLLFDLTAAENVALGLKFRRVKNFSRQVDVWLEKLGIAHLKKRRALTLSGGEAQKVALARALAYSPKKLYLDEPTANLDPGSQAAARLQLLKLIKEKEIDVTWVTHNLAEALAVADYLMVMLDRRIVQEGQPEEVVHKPASAEIAAFLGIENIFHGAIAGSFFENPKVRFEAASADQASAWAVVHPEDIILSGHPLPGTSARNCLTGAVAEIMPLGLLYKIKVKAGENFMVTVTRASKEQLDLTVGKDIFLIFKATAVHII